MIRASLFILTFLISAINISTAQILSITPVFPTVEDTVTIIYDATEGNGALVGISPVYAHTGLITSSSSSPTDWKYVQGTWGIADPNVIMTDLGNNLHEIKYHIRSFYNVPQNETVLKLAFVFRDAAGNNVGRAADGSDIYYDVYSANSPLITAFITPTAQSLAVNSGDNISIHGAASDTATMTLFDNGTQISQVYDKNIYHTITAAGSGNHMVELVVDDGTNTVRDTFNYVINPTLTIQAMPTNTELGVNYVNDTTVRLRLYAPNKNFIYVVGDFNDWNLDANYYMNQDPDGANWWIEISGLTADTEYGFQYFIDNTIKIADPYSEKVLDPSNDPWISSATYPNLKPYPSGKTTGIVGVMHPGKPAYAWQVTNFTKPAKEEMVVYELLVRDFLAAHDYKTLKDTLDYLQTLGINTIELMPVNEFEGNESWGYNPSFHMALDKYYGPADDFKAFIDECHNRGIAVILDVVYNHAFSQSPLCQLYWDNTNFQPSASNPWLNPTARHPFNVGYDFNHESPATREFVDRVMLYWINEFKVDGFRFDLSKGFTQTNNPNNVGAWGQYDASRIAILKHYADVCWTADPNFYVVLEHFSDNSEEKELANYGMMFWGNHNHDYTEAAMGYPSSFSWISYKQRGWNDPHVIGYMESHDEERMIFKNVTFGNSSGSYDIQYLGTALDRAEQAAAFFFTIPGPKLMWQFGELGYDYSIDYNGRVGNKPIKWDYFTEGHRKDLYDAYTALIHLKTDNPVFNTTDFSLAVGGTGKRIKLNHSSMDVCIIGNFDVVQQSVFPAFQNAGDWYNYINGDTLTVTDPNAGIVLAPGEYRIYTSVPINNPYYTNTKELDNSDKFLLNAYPNPASTFTTIAYHLEESTNVQVDLFDLMGKKVVNLANEQQTAGDQYINVDTSELPKGSYLVRLVANGQVSTQRIVVL